MDIIQNYQIVSRGTIPWTNLENRVVRKENLIHRDCFVSPCPFAIINVLRLPGELYTPVFKSHCVPPKTKNIRKRKEMFLFFSMMLSNFEHISCIHVKCDAFWSKCRSQHEVDVTPFLLSFAPACPPAEEARRSENVWRHEWKKTFTHAHENGILLPAVSWREENILKEILSLLMNVITICIIFFLTQSLLRPTLNVRKSV